MLNLSRPILRNARILAAILHHDMANVDVTNYIAMDSDVLSDHKSVLAAYERANKYGREEKMRASVSV